MAKEGASKELKRATEKYHGILLKHQQLQKQFVNEPEHKKRELLKAKLIASHKEAKAAEKEFNQVIASEPVDYESLAELKKTIKEAIRSVLKEAWRPGSMADKIQKNDHKLLARLWDRNATFQPAFFKRNKEYKIFKNQPYEKLPKEFKTFIMKWLQRNMK